MQCIQHECANHLASKQQILWWTATTQWAGKQLCITALIKQNALGSIPPAHGWDWVPGCCETHWISPVRIVVYQAKPSGNPPNTFAPDVSTGLETGAKDPASNAQCHTIEINFPFSGVLQYIVFNIPFTAELQCWSLGSPQAPGAWCRRWKQLPALHCPSASCHQVARPSYFMHTRPVVGPAWKGAWSIMIQCHLLVLCRLPSWRH